MPDWVEALMRNLPLDTSMAGAKLAVLQPETPQPPTILSPVSSCSTPTGASTVLPSWHGSHAAERVLWRRDPGVPHKAVLVPAMCPHSHLYFS